MAVIPVATPRRARTPFLVSPPAHTIQQVVYLRSKATSPATSTRTLFANTADANTATGVGALLNNTTGANNTANGVFALFDNTTGGNNTAAGLAALGDNTAGSNNTAIGYQALSSIERSRNSKRPLQSSKRTSKQLPRTSRSRSKR